jgi:O-antigen/teichoic acid export membrane protein
MAHGRHIIDGPGVARTSLLSVLALIVLGGTRILYGSIVSRSTDHETYGTVGVLLATSLIATYVVPAGIGSAISRFIPFSRGQGDLVMARGFYRFLQRAGLVAALLLGLAAALLASTVLAVGPSNAVQVGLLTIAFSLYTLYKAALYGFSRVERYVGLEVTSSVVVLGSTLLIVGTASDIYLLPLVIGYVVFAVGAWVTLRADVGGLATSPAHTARGDVVGYVILAGIGILAGAGFLQATQLLADIFAAGSGVAYMAAAVALVAPLYFLPRALGLALFPFMSEAHGAGEVNVVRHHADLVTRALFALTAPPLAASILLAPWIMVLFGGASYADGGQILQIMFVGAYAAVVQVACVNALSSGSRRDLRIPVGWAVAGCLVGVGVAVIVGPRLGATGVAIAYLVGMVVSASGPISVVWRRHRMDWGGLIGRAIVLVAVAFSIGRVIDIWLPDQPIKGLLLAIGAVAVGAGTALALRRDISAVLSPTQSSASRSSVGRRPGDHQPATDPAAAFGGPSHLGE